MELRDNSALSPVSLVGEGLAVTMGTVRSRELSYLQMTQPQQNHY